MNEEESRIRDQWLIMWIVSGLMSLIGVFLLVWFNPGFQIDPESTRYWKLAVPILSIVGFLIIKYYCIYKKGGVKLLDFIIGFTILSLVINPFSYWMGYLPMSNYIPYYIVYLVANEVIDVLWLIACRRMRKVNERLQLVSL